MGWIVPNAHFLGSLAAEPVAFDHDGIGRENDFGEHAAIVAYSIWRAVPYVVVVVLHNAQNTLLVIQIVLEHIVEERFVAENELRHRLPYLAAFGLARIFRHLAQQLGVPYEVFAKPRIVCKTEHVGFGGYDADAFGHAPRHFRGMVAGKVRTRLCLV